MQKCMQMVRIANGEIGARFPSKSSSKEYRVYAFREGEVPFCNCMGFIMSRKKDAVARGIPTENGTGTCPHIREVMAHTCQWQQTTAEDYRYDSTCPSCGGPLWDTDNPVLPADVSGMEQDLEILLTELLDDSAYGRSVSAPAPVSSGSAPAATRESLEDLLAKLPRS